MSIQLHEVGVTAELTIEVNRSGEGDLTDGVEVALARIEAVRAVEAFNVTGLTPRLNDLQADVEAELTVTVERPDEDAVVEALEDGFGVTVDAVAVEHPPP